MVHIWMVCQEMRGNWKECAMLLTGEEQKCGGKRSYSMSQDGDGKDFVQPG